MPKQHVIKVLKPRNESMGASFQVLLDVLQQVSKVEENDSIVIDMRSVTFVIPFLILPLAALINHLERNNTKITINPSAKCGDYLDTIRFARGFDAIVEHDWMKKLNYFKKKSYLPILNIPSGDDRTTFRESLLTTLDEILQQQLKIDNRLFTPMSYLISEAFDNIVEHANIGNGWIMVQNYPTKEFFDICIIDTGIGILGSYISKGFPDIITHEKALQEAINGRSTKIGEISRGFGIRTSRHMLVNGLGGKYFIFSGNAFYIWTKEQEQINALDLDYQWPGTMLALRIPNVTPEGFNYVNYIE
jgi:anti-sigma regulatory factor (Ser/Thr protein kinase)